MNNITINQFRNHLKNFVEQVTSQHIPIRISRRNGSDFIVISAEDWEREQETLYVLQNSSLVRQIAASSLTHKEQSGYSPTSEQINEIIGI